MYDCYNSQRQSHITSASAAKNATADAVGRGPSESTALWSSEQNDPLEPRRRFLLPAFDIIVRLKRLRL